MTDSSVTKPIELEQLPHLMGGGGERVGDNPSEGLSTLKKDEDNAAKDQGSSKQRMDVNTDLNDEGDSSSEDTVSSASEVEEDHGKRGSGNALSPKRKRTPEEEEQRQRKKAKKEKKEKRRQDKEKRRQQRQLKKRLRHLMKV